jgi:tetraacyldisaccharide 4'-kinase
MNKKPSPESHAEGFLLLAFLIVNILLQYFAGSNYLYAMIQQTLLRLLLSPFALLYGIGVGLRNLLYRIGMLKSVHFDLPVISVGNLSVGGTGKTPHIEYLIQLLKNHLDLGVLSRGYMRKSRGYRLVTHRNSAADVGDEPLQFKLKYPDIMVAVAESRSFAIPQMVMTNPNLQLILLDDAFQHRSIQPAMHIMLTEHRLLFTRDYLLPAGRLREWRSAYKRADVIIVSKCPPTMTREEADAIRAEIQPYPHQQIYFTTYQYGIPYRLFDVQDRISLHENTAVLLISAIANTDFLFNYLETAVGYIDGMSFEDHHYFTPYEMDQLGLRFDQLPDDHDRIILSTEKDATRLALHGEWLRERNLPIYILPVGVRFLFDQGPQFDEMIRQFLLDFKS